MDLKTLFGAYFDSKEIDTKDKKRLIDKALKLHADIENQHEL